MRIGPKTLIFTSVALFLGLSVGVLVWYSSGLRSGQEFSPDDFSRRNFSYNVDPWFGWVLSKRVNTPVTVGLHQELVQDGLVQPVNHQPQRWHLVHDSGSTRAGRPSHDCDARLLIDYLELFNDEGELVWRLWNLDHPQLAKVFWPRIAELARDEMYLQIPPLMAWVLDGHPSDLASFDAELRQRVAEAYRTMGSLDEELGRADRAQQRLLKARQYDPQGGSERAPTGQTP